MRTIYKPSSTQNEFLNCTLIYREGREVLVAPAGNNWMLLRFHIGKPLEIPAVYKTREEAEVAAHQLLEEECDEDNL